MNEKIGHICALLFVGYLSVRDIKERKISVTALLISGAFAVFYLIIMVQPDIEYVLYAMFPGMFFLLLSFITKEHIGYGDGFVLLILGLWCGGFWTFTAALLAVFLTGFYAVFLLLKKKQKTIPLVPFLLFAMEVIFLYE